MAKQVKWTEYATCRGMTPNSPEDDFFFDAYEASEEVAKAVDQMCISCPVRKHCLDYGVSKKIQGVWGGIYLTPQGNIDKNKNGHKTEEVWELLS